MIRSTLSIFLLFTLLGRTTSACSITLCSDINYVGPCVTYAVGMYPSLGAHHKYYSSAYISGSNCLALFYHEQSYSRFHYTISTNVANFHHIGFNDALGSLQVVSTYCGAGTYFYSTSHANYGCTACPAGTSKSSGAACSWGSTCSHQCTPCTAGTFSSGGGWGTCQSCPTGHYQHQSGQTGCMACGVGTFTSVVGSTHCSACHAGSYAQSTGQSSCNACPTGTYQDLQGQSTCRRCEKGSYAETQGLRSCSYCGIGSYSDVFGASSCKSCAPRKRGLTNGAISESAGCGWCPAGTYQPGHGYATCNPCDAGNVSVEGSLECTPCPAGSIPNPASSTCDLCPGGTYQPLDGQTTCIACPTGSASSQGASECSPCPAGTFPDETSSSCQPCHDNLIGFNNACYGTMDFDDCPATADVGECEFQSQDDSFNLLPGCELVEFSDEIVVNVIQPEENRFGANKIIMGMECTPQMQAERTFAATGCPNPNPETIPGTVNWWVDQDSPFGDMMAYCTRTRDGIATQAQKDVCCGIGNDCGNELSCVEQTSLVACSTDDMVVTVSNGTVNATQFDEGKVLIKCKVGNIVPSLSPTVAPSQAPTSEQPTVTPSSSPTTSDPTTSPSLSPSDQPTVAPSQLPTTDQPTGVPSTNPTSNPSGSPTVDPTKAPTFTAPTLSPTFTTSPTQSPSKTPTVAPSIAPSATEVLKVEESENNNFLIILFVTIGSVLCCFALVVLAFFRNRKVAEEYAKRTPDQRVNDVENVETSKSPVTIEEKLNQSWEIQIEE